MKKLRKVLVGLALALMLVATSAAMEVKAASVSEIEKAIEEGKEVLSLSAEGESIAAIGAKVTDAKKNFYLYVESAKIVKSGDDIQIIFSYTTSYKALVKTRNADYDCGKDAEALLESVKALAKNAAAKKSDRAKVKALDKAIRAAVSYRYGEGGKYASHTVEAAVYDGTATCPGYSQLMQLCLATMGIESRITTGKNRNHCWNDIKIDGKWYYTDSTWNDTLDADTYILIPHAEWIDVSRKQAEWQDHIA